MVIKELEIKNLFGFLDKSLIFKNKIAILVGINGAGKTSVLNLINWVLTPNIGELCSIEFKSIKLKFNYKGEDHLLTCLQNEIELTIDLENITKGLKYHQIQATFKIHPSKLTKNNQLKNSLSGEYDALGPDVNERETWRFLFEELPKPFVIGLDRALYTEYAGEISIVKEFQTNKKRVFPKERLGPASSPIDKVKSILFQQHNLYKNGVLKFYSALNEKIMLSAFDDTFTNISVANMLKAPKPSVETIDRLNEQVVEFLKENRSINSNPSRKASASSISKVNNYFKNLKKIIKGKENSSSEKKITATALQISQFKKINDLVAEFKKFEDDTKKMYLPIKEFLDTINGFLKDSAKQLYFDKESSEVRFNIFNKLDKQIDDGREIANLSSGEKQLLILFTYLKFNPMINIFIIDEPELSLHPKWQGEFLDAVNKLMSNEAQLIIATHSPEIIGDKRDLCNVLLPYNI